MGKGGGSKPASTVHCTGESWILRASFYCTAVRASHDAPEQRLNSQDGPPAENRGVGDRGGGNEPRGGPRLAGVRCKPTEEDHQDHIGPRVAASSLCAEQVLCR